MYELLGSGIYLVGVTIFVMQASQSRTCNPPALASQGLGCTSMASVCHCTKLCFQTFITFLFICSQRSANSMQGSREC